MRKRQDARLLSLDSIFPLLASVALLFTGACQLFPDLPEPRTSPEATETGLNPTQTLNPSPSPTAEPTSEQVTITLTPDCRQENNEVETASFFTERLNDAFHFLIYLPPCYTEDAQESFPVVYLLHGLSYNNDQWLRLGLKDRMDHMIGRGELPPFIVVLPLEAPTEPPQVSLFHEILTEELIPWIDTNYRTLPEKRFRGIGGLSRGAAWAVQIGFEHPALFCCVGAHSLPLFQADAGKINPWLTQNPNEELPRVLIDIGRNDRDRMSAQDFANQLDAAHVPHEWYLFKYGHTEAYWSSHLDLYLNWYARNW